MTIPEPPAAQSVVEQVTPAAPPSWWRRNALALVALAVFVPATVLAIGWQGWHEFYGYGTRPYQPILVEEGEAEFVGATFGPVRSGEIDDLSGLDVPEGATLLAAAVPVDAGSEGVSCEVVLVHQATGREWMSARTEIGLLSDVDEPERCNTADTGRYEVIVPFVLPDDVDGPFWLDVRSPGDESAGSFLRFPIDP